MICAILASVWMMPLDAAITVNGQTGRADVLLTQIAQQAGVKIKVTGAPLRDYLYLRVTNRPLDSTLNLLAEASDATWEQKNGEIIFTAPWPSPRSEEKDQLLSLMKWFEGNPILPPLTDSEIQDIAVKLAGGDMERLAAGRAISAKLPLERLHRSLLHKLNVEGLMKLPLNETRTFAEQPKGSRVLSFPGGMSSMLREFSRDAAEFSRRMERIGVTKDSRSVPGELRDNLFDQPEKIFCYLTIRRTANQVFSELLLMDSETLKPVGEADETLNTFSTTSNPEPARQFPETWTPSADIRTQEIYDGDGTDFSTFPKYSEATLDRIVANSPDDPLISPTAHLFDQVASSTQKDIAAIVSDGAASELWWFAKQPNMALTQGNALRRIYGDFKGVVVKPDVLIFRPGNLADDRIPRIPREGFAKSIALGRSADSTSIETLVPLLNQCESVSQADYAVATFAAAFGKHMEFFGGGDALWFWSRLPRDKRLRLESERQAISYGELDPVQKGIVLAWISGSAEFHSSTANTTIPGSLAVPGEIPTSTMIFLTPSNSSGFRYQADGAASEMTLRQVAQAIQLKRAGKDDPTLPDDARLAYIPAKSITIRADFTQGISSVVYGKIGETRADQAYYPLDDLPEKTVEAINAEIELMKEELEAARNRRIRPSWVQSLQAGMRPITPAKPSMSISQRIHARPNGQTSALARPRSGANNLKRHIDNLIRRR